MPPPKREPLWVVSFLAALGVCGNVTRSAALAGVDVTGPYNRRMRYPEFRDAWVRVMDEREARASGMTDAQETPPPAALVAHGAGVSPAHHAGALPAEVGREELALSGTGVRRVAASRWSKGAEEAFLEELTASANVARAAAAAGFSATAIYKRKLRDQHFAAGWDAAIAVGRSRLEAHLIVAAERAFDPEGLPIVEGAPRVSVTEAIAILKHKPAGTGTAADDFPTWQEEADKLSTAEVDALREKIIAKLERTRIVNDREKLEQGWVQDGDAWIPPGWVRA